MVLRSLVILDFVNIVFMGSTRWVSFKSTIHNTKGIIDYAHFDLVGPSRKSSLVGCNYLLTFIDGYSRTIWCYFIKHKDDVFDVFIDWKTIIEFETGKSIKTLRIDNGLEFVEKKFLQ